MARIHERTVPCGVSDNRANLTDASNTFMNRDWKCATLCNVKPVRNGQRPPQRPGLGIIGDGPHVGEYGAINCNGVWRKLM